ncbi:MAG: 4Fe-4S dicluster domain-containing protein [Bacteroidetes bacterium]|nr:4Fe-4S dicluster domain-containing protein [Bacteroidota bacterium]
MAIKITDVCINCGACEPECPNGAIYANGDSWKISDKTSVSSTYTLLDGSTTEPGAVHTPISDDYFYIVTDKCTECKGFHDEPQCASVCPVDCCLPDLDHQETEDVLLARKSRLHTA